MSVWSLARSASASFVILCISATSSLAGVSPDTCAQLREYADDAETQWFGLQANGRPVPLRPGNSYLAKELSTVVYIHKRTDGFAEPTIMGIKLTYSTENNDQDRDVVRVRNNFKSKAFPTTFEEYQSFHHAKSENYELKTRFHLTRGLFRRGIPFSTFLPVDRRKQLAYSPARAEVEQTYRSYIITMHGISPEGSCIDFEAHLPLGTREISIEVVDLEPNPESGIFYRARLTTKVQ